MYGYILLLCLPYMEEAHLPSQCHRQPRLVQFGQVQTLSVNSLVRGPRYTPRVFLPTCLLALLAHAAGPPYHGPKEGC